MSDLYKDLIKHNLIQSLGFSKLRMRVSNPISGSILTLCIIQFHYTQATSPFNRRAIRSGVLLFAQINYKINLLLRYFQKMPFCQ